MATQIVNVFNQDIINEILQFPEVQQAKTKIDKLTSGSVYFTIQLTESIKEIIYNSFGIDLSSVQNIPMRWIKGDTKPHIDVATNKFEKTHLVYLTDSSGEFIIDNTSYPITQGTGYTFSEQLLHETIGTGTGPRLLFGPMSETGFSVGAATTIYADGQTEVIYFSYVSGSGLFYRINNGSLNGLSLPITIVNTNTSYRLKVLFETSITIENTIAYFVCGSENIQFGSESLDASGNRTFITIDINNYPGLIRNGDSSNSGFNNIYIYNLVVNGTGYQTSYGGGWVGQEYFGRAANNNYITNCLTDGTIDDLGGGIVGQSSGSYTGVLTIIGCSSSGSIGSYAGGIAGHYAGYLNGSVTCEKCWTTGSIGLEGGGIFGDYGGTGGSAAATKCYSEGLIGQGAGGIFGANAAESSGSATAEKCYSKGNIQTDGGGIYGKLAGFNSGITQATNCYSSGSVTTSGTGIYGSSKANGTATNCYIANSSWSSSTANTSLQGVPSSSSVGTTWVAATANQPYELNAFGFSPYTQNVITASSSDLVQNYSQTIQQGQSSDSALTADASGNAFVILEKSGGDSSSYSTITMSSQTGSISTTSATVPGTYTITLRSVGSYNITTFTLTVNEATITITDDCCSRTLDLQDLDYRTRNEILAGNMIISNINSRRTAISYSDLIKMKMAYAAKQ